MDDMAWYCEYFGVAADESLAHYGVKGMKWGQRKERLVAGVRKYGGKAKEAAKARLRAMGEQTVAAAKAAAAQHKQNRIEKKQDKVQEKQNAKMDKKINKMDNDPNYVKRMSDEELVAAIKRKKLEQEYENLNATPMNQFKKKVRNKVSEVGANMVGKALETIGMGFINTAAAKVEQKQKIKKEQAEEEVKKRLTTDANKEIADIIDMMGGWSPAEAGKLTSKDINEFMNIQKKAKEFNEVYSQTEAGKATKKAWDEKKKAATPEGKKEAERKAAAEKKAAAKKAKKSIEENSQRHDTTDVSPYAHPEDYVKPTKRKPGKHDLGDRSASSYSRYSPEVQAAIDERMKRSPKGSYAQAVDAAVGEQRIKEFFEEGVSNYSKPKMSVVNGGKKKRKKR